MCWSWKVSFMFALGQFIGLMLPWDFTNVPKIPDSSAYSLNWLRHAMIPVVLQEFLQGVLWLIIDYVDPLYVDAVISGRNGIAEQSCSSYNVGITMLLFIIVLMVPFSFGSALTRATNINKSKMVLLINFTKAWTALILFCRLASFLTTKNPQDNCTRIGKYHHQVWPVRFEPNHWLVYNVYMFGYGLLPPVFFYLYGPEDRWVMAGLFFIFCTLHCLSYKLVTHEEFGSVWCWSCSAVVAFRILVIYGRLLKEKRDTELFIPGLTTSLIVSLFFLICGAVVFMK